MWVSDKAAPCPLSCLWCPQTTTAWIESDSVTMGWCLRPYLQIQVSFDQPLNHSCSKAGFMVETTQLFSKLPYMFHSLQVDHIDHKHPLFVAPFTD